MSMLLFMPWCPIDKRYDVGEISILPFERHAPIEGLDDTGHCRINAIMATYKDIQSKPVHKAALVKYGNKSPIAHLEDGEVDVAQELVALACFSGLAKREYFNQLGSYCNSACFSLLIQKFDKADFTSLTIRRREGRTLSGWRIDDIAESIPTHCHTVRKVSLDEALLKALTSHRTQSKNEEWARWQNSISCFNQANTDSENVRFQVEWVLLCSAFEHLLEARSEAKDVASKFTEAMVPSESLLAHQAERRSDNWTDGGKSLRYEWMREFYRIRGDFAHGKLETVQPAIWSPGEHLLLATIAFPLFVKSLLKRASTYEPTDEDQVQIDVFEKFADTKDLLRPPQKNSLDSHWQRLLQDRRWKFTVERPCHDLKSTELVPEKTDGSDESPESAS